MIKIAPSLLASDFSKLGEEILKIQAAGADYVHIDVMDGLFVPNITIGPPVVKSLRKVTDMPFDVHLMIDKPEKYIDAFVSAGADIISVHPEATTHLHRTLQTIRQKGAKACIALNPSTPLSVLDWVLEDIDMLLLMTVNPGYGGQSYIEAMTGKIAQARELADKKGLKLDIEVDGGIDLSNIYKVREAGANVIVAGTAIFGAPDAKEAVKMLREKAFPGSGGEV